MRGARGPDDFEPDDDDQEDVESDWDWDWENDRRRDLAEERGR